MKQTTADQIGQEYFTALTGIRGVAALMVVMGHLVDAMAETNSVARKILYNLFQTPGIQVHLFFLLSGFIMMHVYGKRETLNKPLWYLTFLRSRLARFYPVYLAAILLMILPLIFGSLVGESFSRGDTALGILIPNIVLIQQWGLGIKNIVFPTWATSVEWFAYIFLFPICLFLYLRIKRSGYHVLAVLAGLAVAFLWSNYSYKHGAPFSGVIQVVVEFTMGAALYGIRKSYFDKIQFLGHWSDCTTIAIFIVSILIRNQTIGNNGLLMLLYCFWILGLSFEHSGYTGLVMRRPEWQWFGAISYSLYTVHDVTMHYLYHFCSLTKAIGHGLGFFLIIMFVNLAVAIGVAAILYYVVEIPCRKFIRGGFRK